MSKFKSVSEAYNSLVPIMNSLIAQDYDLYSFCDNMEGYGFTVKSKINKDEYVHVIFFFMAHDEVEFYVERKKRCTEFVSDVVNDAVISKTKYIDDVSKIENKVLEYLTARKAVITPTNRQLEIVLDYLEEKYKDEKISITDIRKSLLK